MMLSSNTKKIEFPPLVFGILGDNAVLTAHLKNFKATNCAFLELTDVLLDSGALITCDGVIGILDGNLGISPTFISAWNEAKDHDLPRVIVTINTITGRADFDEAISLGELVLNEDIAMRYYPIQSEEEPKYVGLLDVLTNEICQPQKSPIPADQEHIDLTIAEHDELIDLLVHADLTDVIFENHLAGLPISMPRLRELWLSDEIVTLLPMDQFISDTQILDWIAARKPRWLPTVSSDNGIQNIYEINKTLGIGIASGVARIWHHNPNTMLELITESSEVIPIKNEKKILIYNSNVRRGDSIRPRNTSYLVIPPSI